MRKDEWGRMRKAYGSQSSKLASGEIGPRIYQVAAIILRDIGNDTHGRKTNSRRTPEGECGSATGDEGDRWKSPHIADCFLTMKERIVGYVMISPFEIYELLVETNREHQGRMEIRSGGFRGERDVPDSQNHGEDSRKHGRGYGFEECVGGVNTNPDRNTGPNILIHLRWNAGASGDTRCFFGVD